jgi:hypothetical protein
MKRFATARAEARAALSLIKVPVWVLAQGRSNKLATQSHDLLLYSTQPPPVYQVALCCSEQCSKAGKR